MTPRSALWLVLLAVLALPARAQESGLAFLRVGLNAAAGAMGDAHVARSRDAFSTYWNPAGLAAAPSNSASLSYHLWVADVRTYTLAARFRAGAQGGLGLFVAGTDFGDFEAREEPGEAGDLFNVQFINLGAAYGRRIGPVRAGLTARYLSNRIYTESASGYAFDLGLQAELWDGSLELGAALQNLGEMGRLAEEELTLPRMVRAGLAVFPLRILAADDDTPVLNTFVTAEVSHVFPTETTQFHAGASATVMELLVLRAGLLTNNELRRFTFGLGLHYEAFRFDYAFLPFREGFAGPGHILTLTYGW
jgi:hypothetical protein